MFFSEEVDRITLSSNDERKIQSIDSVETYEYRTSKHLVCKKE